MARVHAGARQTRARRGVGLRAHAALGGRALHSRAMAAAPHRARLSRARPRRRLSPAALGTDAGGRSRGGARRDAGRAGGTRRPTACSATCWVRGRQAAACSSCCTPPTTWPATPRPRGHGAGPGKLPAALRRAAEQAGVTIVTGAGVAEVLTDSAATATGVRLDDGRTLDAAIGRVGHRSQEHLRHVRSDGVAGRVPLARQQLPRQGRAREGEPGALGSAGRARRRSRATGHAAAHGARRRRDGTRLRPREVRALLARAVARGRHPHARAIPRWRRPART